MRIAAARVIPVRLRFALPVQTARGQFSERAAVLLELRDPDGAVGYGEAAPWPGFGTESVADAEQVLRSVAAQLADADADPARWSPAEPRLRDAGPAARAALEAALCDLAARRAGEPLAAYLARQSAAPGHALARVAISALLVARTPEAIRDEAMRARAAGYRAAKLKLGGVPLSHDVERVRAARDGLGAGIRLRGDANGAWTLAEALAALEALVPFAPEYVEQPVPADDVAGLAELRRRALVPIAADEAVAGEQGLARVLAAGAADVVVLKPAMLGGPLRALQLAARARAAGAAVVFTHAFESAIGARHVLHCASAWGDPDAVHGLQTAGLFVNDVAEPAACGDGWTIVPAAPGIGVVL